MSYWEVFHLVQTLSHSLFASHLTEGFTEPDELVGNHSCLQQRRFPRLDGTFLRRQRLPFNQDSFKPCHLRVARRE
jgi:hypothetical protein